MQVIPCLLRLVKKKKNPDEEKAVKVHSKYYSMLEKILRKRE